VALLVLEIKPVGKSVMYMDSFIVEVPYGMTRALFEK